MKAKFLSLLITLILISNAYSQEGVSYTPPTPIPGDTLIITFDVAQNWEHGGSIPGSMVMHWGINGKSTQAGQTPWQWPSSDAWPAGTISGVDNSGNKYLRSPMTRVGNSYQLTIVTNDEFSVLNFVFNSGTPSSFGSNWYHDRTPQGGSADWAISFTIGWRPFSPDPNEQVRITVRDCEAGASVYWTVTSLGQLHSPLERYWPENTELYGDLGVKTEMTGPDQFGECHAILGPFMSGRQVVESVNFSLIWNDGTADSISYSIVADFTPKEEDAEITFIEPIKGATLTPPIDIHAISPLAENVELWAGPDSLGAWYATDARTQWDPSADIFGMQYIIARSRNESDRVTFKLLPIFVKPEIIRAPAPPGITEGATQNGNEVTLSVYAPGRSVVALKGDFNTKYPAGELMKLSGDTLWWLTKTLPDGDYLYQYNFEGKKYIADPWSKDLLWINPGTGEEAWDYRFAHTELHVRADSFAWTDDAYQRPALKDLIIYEMHLGDFSGDPKNPGTYQYLTEKVESGYFDDLGITAIELMPVNEFEGSVSWGYNPSFHIAPESSYGTAEELKRLVNTCHAHGIAVILDVVFNHAWGSSSLWQMNDLEGLHDTRNDHYFYGSSIWGYKLEHWRSLGGKKYRTWKYISETLRTFIEDYHIDGFRYDVSHGVGWDHVNRQGMAYYVWYVHQLDSTAYNICEDFPGGATWTNINASTDADAGWHADFHWRMKDALVLDQRIMTDIARVISFDGYKEFTGPVNYTVSHDERRVIYELRLNGLSFARTRAKLGATICLTSLGIPMLYHGQELAQNSSNRNSGGSPVPEPLQWDNLDESWGRDMYDHYRKLIWLRKNREVLRSPNLDVKVESNGGNHLIYWRSDGDEKVVVAANFNTGAKTTDIPVPNPGTWYEFLTDDSVHTFSTSLDDYQIPGSSARIFCNVRDWDSLATSVRSAAKEAIPCEFQLMQNYPNPFNPDTKIRFSTPAAGHVSLIVYNALGQKVKTLFDRELSTGHHEVNWDAKDNDGQHVSSGVYLIRLSSGGRQMTRKMMFLK